MVTCTFPLDSAIKEQKSPKIVLVNPNNRKLNPLSAIEPPIWLGMMASTMDCVVVDAEAENLTIDETLGRVTSYDPDKVIIVVMGANPSASSTPKMPVAEAILEGLKSYLIPAQLTGLHPQAIGELRGTWDWDGYKQTPPVAWDKLPMGTYRAHNWHCLGKPRQPYGVLYTSLNCPFDCSYCNIHTLYGGSRKGYYRPMVEIINELNLFGDQYNIKALKIWDELFTLDHARVYQICEHLRRYDFNIWAYARVGTVDPLILKRMKQAGINWLCYGFETANPTVQGKGHTRKELDETVEMTREAGINIIGNFIFGLPNDNYGTMSETLQWAKEKNLEYVNFYVAMPYPGSQLYRETPREHLPPTWEAYDQFSPNCKPLPTKYLTSREVLNFRDIAFRSYFNRPEYLSMIEDKFGASNEIKEMLEWDMTRNSVIT